MNSTRRFARRLARARVQTGLEQITATSCGELRRGLALAFTGEQLLALIDALYEAHFESLPAGPETLALAEGLFVLRSDRARTHANLANFAIGLIRRIHRNPLLDHGPLTRAIVDAYAPVARARGEAPKVLVHT